MTLRTNARVAGFAFLIYIAAGLTTLALSRRAVAGADTAAQLTSIAQHVGAMRVIYVLDLICCFCALVLGVTLHAITRDEDPDLALLALTCRVAEGVVIAAALHVTLGKLWLATAVVRPDATTTGALAAYLLKLPRSGNLPATFFAVGSAIFSWLLLRGRIVPVWMAWLGVFASALIVVLLPLQDVGLAGSPVTEIMWLPMLVFELTLAGWLIVKGAAAPARRRAASPGHSSDFKA